MAAALAVLTAVPVAAGPETEVDLALVIAVDVSYSMDPDEQELQRQGFVEAFRSALVHDAIRRGMIGRIGVIYMEWAGASDQQVLLPWTAIDNPESAMAFAGALAEKPTRRASRTSVSGAIDFSAGLLARSGMAPTRQVIDVSGDGPNNQGRPVTAARDEAVAKGITVNGLPIMLKAPGPWDIEDLDLYYRDCVIGGQGAFMVPVRDRAQFVQAVKTKILLEVAGRPPAEPLVKPAQTLEGRANCLAGEQRLQNRWGN
ncbi:MAG TPA: DUF1194 domain-containing protein [Beijerinckiaceae bacterium]|nr:DUF1194 domain-containing protein [Beijerinckiaceae bacterium]